MASKVRITQIRSEIGKNKRQKATVKALGLKMHKTVEHPVNPSILGMVRSIQHLVHVDTLK